MFSWLIASGYPEPLLKRVKQLEATGCITRAEPPENLGLSS